MGYQRAALLSPRYRRVLMAGDEMDDFWNADEQQTIMDLVLLGIRQAEQAVEKNWGSNITNISNRLRYLSLLA